MDGQDPNGFKLGNEHLESTFFAIAATQVGLYNFYVKSQGADDGWACHITVNGVQKAVRRRGFCVVIFNPATGTFGSDTSDTYAQSTSEVKNRYIS